MHRHRREDDLPRCGENRVPNREGEGVAANCEDRHRARVGEQCIKAFRQRGIDCCFRHIRLPYASQVSIPMNGGYRLCGSSTSSQRAPCTCPSGQFVGGVGGCCCFVCCGCRI